MEEESTADAIRGLLSRETYRPWSLARMTDDDVANHMAILLNRGLWHLHAPALPESDGGVWSALDLEEDLADIDPAPKKPTPKKCWVDDYDKEISVDTYGRYFKKYKADGTTEVPLHDSVPFKIYAPVKSGTDITVEVRFKVEKDDDVGDADVASAKSKLVNGVNKNWNNKFKLVADDPECPSKTFKITFKPVWVDSGQHYTIKVHDTYDREGVTGDVMDVSKTTDPWTYAHEFGHCFGLPDEYSYVATETQKMKYIKPDGTLDAAISAPPSKSKNAADATIMSSVNSLKTLPRHAWCIAIEVQELLTQKIGRTIKCTIQ